MLKVEDSTIEASSLTVRDYLADWLAQMRTRFRPSTYDGYAFLIQHHALPAIGHLALGEVQPPTHPAGVRQDDLTGLRGAARSGLATPQASDLRSVDSASLTAWLLRLATPKMRRSGSV